MKALLAVAFLCTVLLSTTPSASAQGDEKNYYSRRYDSLDVNTIFRSSRLLNNYVDCLLDKKPCPPEGKDLKRVLPEALRTRCGRCTKLQKEKSLDVITRLYYQHSQMYTALAERYDPTGEYTRNFERWFDEQNAVKPRPPIPQSQNFLTTRIPSTWITAPAKTKKITLSTTSSRPTLRTLPPTVRTAPPREDPPPVFRTQPATFRNPSQVPIIQTFEAPRTTPVPETIRTNPPTIRPTTVLFTEPLTTTTLRTTSYQPQLITSPPVERPTTQNEQPPVTVRVPQIIFEAPRIPVTESATIRVSIFPIRDETLPSTESDLREPSTVRTSLGPTRRPPSTRPPVAITRPSIAFDAESPVIFRAPATVRTLAPEPVRPVETNFQPSLLIDNFFVPNQNNPFRRSIDRIFGTGERVVAEVVRSTLGSISSTR